jgi:heme exporter protein A
MLPLLAIVALERRFGPVVALAGVELAVQAGEVILLTGPNGAGKSTLLRAAAGLMRPTCGTVQVEGHDVQRDPAARRLLGFLSHQTMLYDDLTARENLRFAADLHHLDAATTQVRDALDAAGLTPRADDRAAVLSHGTRQRLAIARATLHRPRVLLLDEPFSGLDAGAADLLRRGMHAVVSRAGAVICATHQPADCWELVTRVVMVARGRVIRDTPRPARLDDFMLQVHALAAT